MTCKNIFNNQLKQLHRSAVTLNMPTINLVKEKKALEDVLPKVLNSIVTGPKFIQLPEAASWMKQLFDYTITFRQLGRGLSVPVAYQMLEIPEHFSEETLHIARVLGCSIEIACSLILDDIVDGATTRRGKLCWYRQPNVGPSAINDAVLIYQSMIELLKTNFRKTLFYPDLMSVFNQTVLYTSMGEVLEASSVYNKEKNNVNVFTIERVSTIAIHKTAYLSFRLPILLALLLVKNGKEKSSKELNDICFEFGKLIQFQNDYLDIYGEETITGKAGTDIQEGKCSWVAVTALQRCNEIQRSIFKEYYGSTDPDHVKQIKQLYDELHLPQIYEEYERIVYDDLVRRIHALPTKESKFFLQLLDACYKRIY